MGAGWLALKHNNVTLAPNTSRLLHCHPPRGLWMAAPDGHVSLPEFHPRAEWGISLVWQLLSRKDTFPHNFHTRHTYLTSHGPTLPTGTHLNQLPARVVKLPWLFWNNQDTSRRSWERGHETHECPVSRSSWGPISKKEGRSGWRVGNRQPSPDGVGNACCKSGFIYLVTQ